MSAETDFDVRATAYAGLKRYAVSNGEIDLTSAQRVIAEAWKAIGITIEAGSSACKGVATRAIKYLESAGDLRKVGRHRYEPVTWSAIEESPDYLLSSTGRVKHRETGKVLAIREDPRGRELVRLNGTTKDIAKLTRKQVTRGRNV